jgi:hypothetical protein
MMLLFASCQENSCNPLNTFSGIAERDENGVLKNDDSRDWRFNDHWEPREHNLFEKKYNTDCLSSPRNSIIAYPNPTTGSFNVVFNKGQYAKVDLRLVDFDCNTLISVDDIEDNSVGLQATNFDRKGIVRLYYRFVEDGCEVQGHGDIRIE